MLFRGLRHIHFVGIGGIGMSGIAEVLLSHGFAVSGSDQAEGEITAKISIPPAQIEKAEYWPLADAKAADLAKVRGTPGYTFTNSLYVPPDDINNVRKCFD